MKIGSYVDYNQLRNLARALRENGIQTAGDGYYHFEMSHLAWEKMLKDEFLAALPVKGNTRTVYGLMLKEIREYPYDKTPDEPMEDYK